MYTLGDKKKFGYSMGDKKNTHFSSIGNKIYPISKKSNNTPKLDFSNGLVNVSNSNEVHSEPMIHQVPKPTKTFSQSIEKPHKDSHKDDKKFV